MDYLPLHFNVKDQTVLVVGGGDVAYRKVELLIAAQAVIRVVAVEVTGRLRDLIADQGQVIIGHYEVKHLDDVVLVVAATSDDAVNSQISMDAHAASIPVNVVDKPELCSVIFPAIVDRSPVIMSVGTSGATPVMARYLKSLLDQTIPEGISQLANYLKGKREVLKTQYPDSNLRRKVIEAFLSSPGKELAINNRPDEADAYLDDDEIGVVQGEVYLVGAGPGDPDLLTLRAVQLLQSADVILYDNLVSDLVLQRARRDAYKEFVGKRSGYKSTAQEDINALLVRLAKEGKRVLRLKGGDPFIFGRGGEEIEALVAEKIPFQVIPGISAANGCAAYAGIPLTHRDYSQSVRFVTGHPKDGVVSLAWDDLVSPNQTIVFYMGLGGLASICEQLINHGMSQAMPIAVVSKGTTPEQKVLRGTLETIGGQVASTPLETPTLIIVGEVAGLSHSWSV
ncbi:MAG TPA: uroporphyrinogen-III C-methyltransferase [Gammaproteobacteria bacterium]|nr:uroporphyrinogen-III C-methyltransferase [Gammaproteobacteria bacterium]